MKEIGIIGGGNMGQILATSLLKQGMRQDKLGLSDHDLDTCHSLQQSFGIDVTPHNPSLVMESEVVLLAVKPQSMKAVCAEIAPYARADQLIISIAAGVSTRFLRFYFKGPIIRAMPNTPAKIQQGVTALYPAPFVPDTSVQTAGRLFTACGSIVWIDDEALLDVITAISGSGPAYFFALQETLLACAIQLGLPVPVALHLVKQTAVGAALLATHTTDTPSILKQQVTSKGGTTEQALKVLAAGNWNGLIQKAVVAAIERSKTLVGDQ
eukprot:TRINITY_DN4754_c0_g2_i1.p1 TRINITY_DN4754_c0_g2~~TRINITY_DN4754_c0_g2_i1.p1  ORF type:complete len:268 (+),score=20.29 TRINITY_DN4754_c0_g2_i1:184-987(+)